MLSLIFVGGTAVFSLVSLVLYLITTALLFPKYGESNVKGAIPFYNLFVEASYCWTRTNGLIMVFLAVVTTAFSILVNFVPNAAAMAGSNMILSIAYVIATILFANHKAHAFNKGALMTIVLILIPFIGNLYLAFSSAEYVGSPDRK